MTPVLRKLVFGFVVCVIKIDKHSQCGLMLFINLCLSFLFHSKDPDFINAERLRLHAARIKKKAESKKKRIK
tara:strand:+ start:439 stop:654 length:216 start_codon:yes stop_codon:yes gene_type:complete